MNIQQTPFGQTNDGINIDHFLLTNDNGVQVGITNYGGIVTTLRVPDKHGTLDDVVLGFDTLAEYMADNPFFGVLVGRYANRIGRAKFTLDGIEYKVPQNDGPNSLHGGNRGFDKVVWAVEPCENDKAVGLHLTYESADGEEGYPGDLAVAVDYMLNNRNELRIDYLATTDQTTIVNLTNHSYFNLAGHAKRPSESDVEPITGHIMQIYADHFTPTDDTLIPTGEIRPVDGTPMDFRQPTVIAERIDGAYEPLQQAGGYDHNWVLNRDAVQHGDLNLAATVSEPTSGRQLDVLTTQPGVQFYAGNMMPESMNGKDGCTYPRRGGFCLETQNFPDAPNQPDFPSPILRPGERYEHTTIFRFSVVD